MSLCTYISETLSKLCQNLYACYLAALFCRSIVISCACPVLSMFVHNGQGEVMGKGDILIVTHQRAALDQSDVCDSPFMTIFSCSSETSPYIKFYCLLSSVNLIWCVSVDKTMLYHVLWVWLWLFYLFCSAGHCLSCSDCREVEKEELFCAVLGTTLLHNDMHTCEQHRRQKLLGRAGRGPPAFWPLWATAISGPSTFDSRGPRQSVKNTTIV